MTTLAILEWGIFGAVCMFFVVRAIGRFLGGPLPPDDDDWPTGIGA